MIEHIAMVYAAGDLSANEKHLLGAYCNHTDMHGYCWPSVPRLIDETGMSERTVQRTNALLKKRKLIKALRRINPKTGQQISNLTRVNLPLLESMRRPDRDYGDNLIEEITFEDEVNDETFSQVSGGCQSGTPGGAKLAPRPRQSGTPRGAKLAPKTSCETSGESPPSSPPSHNSTEGAGVAPSARGEGRSPDIDERDGAWVPSPRPAVDSEGQDARLGEARAMLAGLPAPLTPGRRTVAELAPLVAEAFGDGWTAEAVAAYVLADLPEEIKSPRGYLIHKVKDLPPSPPVTAPQTPQAPRPHCGDPRCYSGRIEGEGGVILGRCPSWPHSVDPATAKEAVR